MSTNTQMTTTSPATSSSKPVTGVRRPVWRHGVAVSLLATAVVTALAAAASAAGVSFAVDGEPIPLAGFAQLTLVFSLIGVALAAVLARRARRPRSTFVRATVALTAVSCVPDLITGFDAASTVCLIALHLTAAGLVVPTLARRLAPTR